MDYILIILYVLIFFVSKSVFEKKYGYVFNATFLTTSIWCLFASLSVINPNGLRQPSLTVHFYSITFLVLFNFFSSIFCFNHKKSITSNLRVLDLKKVNKRFIIIETILIMILSPLILLGFKAILNGNGGEYRSMVYFGSDFGFFTRTIPVSLLNILLIISLFFYFRNKSNVYLINTIFLVILISIISAGRGAIFSFIVLYFFMSIIYSSFGSKISRVPLFIALFLMFFMTVFVRNSHLIRSTVSYFSGSFSFLDYILAYPKEYGMDTYHYGFITFSPITEPLMYVLKVLGLTTEKIPSYYFNFYVQDFVDIGDVNNIAMFNNNTTALFAFLIDGGVYGIILGALFLSYLSIKSYGFLIKDNLIGSIFYFYVVYGLFMTTISYQSFMSVNPLLVIIISYLCLKPLLK